MLTWCLYSGRDQLAEEWIHVGPADYAIAVTLDVTWLAWVGWLLSMLVGWVLP